MTNIAADVCTCIIQYMFVQMLGQTKYVYNKAIAST